MSEPIDRRYRVQVVPAAIAAIEEQFLYIRDEQHSPLEAARWLSRVWTAIDGLEFLPGRFLFAPENDYRTYEVRRVVLDNHLLLFTIDEAQQTVYILNLRHGARLPRPEELPDTLADQ